MTSLYWQVAWPILAAWAAGGLIGSERSYHGRAAGFRTHALVALASAAAMMVATAPGFLHGVYPVAVPRFDPTRLAQGVLTGIGFLGAGVIFKEGVNVHGLTTAASLYGTAVVGLLFGAGAPWPAALAAAGVLASLTVLRWLELRLPAHVYASFVFRFRTAAAPTQEELEAMVAKFGLAVRAVSFAQSDGGALRAFSGDLIARHNGALDDLAAHLPKLPDLVEYEVSRISK